MPINRLNQQQRELLESLEARPFKDVAYKLRPDIESYCLTPYRLQEMYGLNGVTQRELVNLRRQISDSFCLYMLDLGNINTIAATKNRLRDQVDASDFDNAVANQYRNRLDYFDDDNLFRSPESWFGYPMLRADRSAGYNYVTNIKRIYPRLAQANEFFDEFESQLEINPETDVPKPRMEFTSRATGVFTFARCAPTLYAFPCFKVRRGQKECIDPSNVREVGKRFYLVDAPDVRVKKYGFQVGEDGATPFRTLAKKVYAIRNSKIKITPYINIYVNVTAVYDTDADDYIYNSFAAIALARLLTTNGFRVSITTLYAIVLDSEIGSHNYPYDAADPFNELARRGTDDRSVSYFLAKFETKSYSELLDYNLALIYGGDPAFFRYDMFNASVMGTYAWHRPLDGSFGSPLDDESRIEQLLDDYNITNLENETRVVIAGRYSEDAASDCVRSKLAELNILYGGSQ